MVPTTALATSNNEYNVSQEYNWFDQFLSFVFGGKAEANNGNYESYFKNDHKEWDKWKDKDYDYWKKNPPPGMEKESIDIWRDWYCYDFPGLGWGVSGIPAKERGDFPGNGNTGGIFPGKGPSNEHRP